MKVYAGLILSIFALILSGYFALSHPIVDVPQETPRFDTVNEIPIHRGPGIKFTGSPTSTPPVFISNTDTIDVHTLPLGDDKVSSAPKAGYVYACQKGFNGGGAFRDGVWIQSDTWDMTKKVAVRGNTLWDQAAFSTYVEKIERVLSGNSLPLESKTGVFPITSDDPAYQYDRNPNSIKAKTYIVRVPAAPTITPSPRCIPMGAIGYALNGVAIFGALDDRGRDALAHEVEDSCGGHPEQNGLYHYHGPSDCIPHINENETLVGYALDGFGIYSRYDKNGHEYTNTDLDVCHGITSEILWDGKPTKMYHYVLTRTYPYTLGCFRGTPVLTDIPGPRDTR